MRGPPIVHTLNCQFYVIFNKKNNLLLTSADHIDLIISELNFQFWFTVWIWVPGFSAMHWLGNLNIAELGYHCCCYKVKDIVVQTRGSLPKNLDVHLDS